ncbi:hypothetical protein Vretimale_19007 [Volvox reticuliferus]|uniref:AMP deaminase n=1 Tax=Volvox reticuliferus TaxID=1737510 RepID=A0A8J4GYK3_9CHLO|nr:hypothetical protein Vretifemale_13077 [Volvox reticuliferus]GIM16399.1 hypothetical protein Vretimale_19007 [Volvox reticuliferus]
MSSDTGKAALLVAAGAAVGGAIAFGAALGLATFYTRRLDQINGQKGREVQTRSELSPSIQRYRPNDSFLEVAPSRPYANEHGLPNGVLPALTKPPAAHMTAPVPLQAPASEPPSASHKTPRQNRSYREYPATAHATPYGITPDGPVALMADAQLVEGESPRAPGQPISRRRGAGDAFPGALNSGGGATAGNSSTGGGTVNGVACGPVILSSGPSGRKLSNNHTQLGGGGGGANHLLGGSTSAAAAAQDRAQKAALDMMIAATGGTGGLATKLGMVPAGAAQGAAVTGDKSGDQLALNAGDEYSRVITPETAMTDEVEEVCGSLVECLELRKHWLFRPALSAEARRHEPEAAVPSDIIPDPFMYEPMPQSGYTFRMVDGVMAVYGPEDGDQLDNLFPVPGTASEFFTDMHRILRYASSGPVKSFCHHRLILLEQKFNLHVMLNSDKEFRAQKAAPHRDFYNVRKVDTHIHHSACMHQKHLLRFIKSKLRKEPDEVVIFRDGKYLTLKEVFESLKLTGYDLNVDTLDMHADKNTFHRFDKFNLKYNPCGQSRLREIFIKQDNLIHGRFLAELTKEVFSDLESSKYQHAEMRISIYGRKAMEWDILAAWVVGFQLHSDNNVWLIQIPRLYNVYKETGVIENFQQMLDNIFEPLFEVTADPSTHPQLHVLLSMVVGFDMVDDESKPERRPTKHTEPPERWNTKHNCAYAYYAYYIYANLYALNKFRESRGLNTFSFRPHAGEAGDVDHLVAAFMLCENIAHGINLRKSPCLQYLYYLAQIGLCMSPLSNNSLFLDYHRNPFPVFFARGLSVSLSTDDPVMIHLTKEPLVEEYSIAAQVFKMSSADLCEIARNGVLHSGFPHACKKHWVAEEYWRPGPDGNDIHKTNVPNLRLRFRHETYCDEMRLVLHGAVAHQARKAAIMAAIRND